MTRHLTTLTAAALAGVLAACSAGAPDEGGSAGTPAATATAAETATATDTAAAAIPSHADWAGKWIGVEGTFVEITAGPDGTYALVMQSDLDTRGTYAGTDAQGGIAFERGGEQLLLKAATGDETGLKYLAGKTDCLMVAQGEGYCRD